MCRQPMQFTAFCVSAGQSIALSVDAKFHNENCWDTFATLAATAKKQDVSFYEYIYDRVSGAYEMPSLADLITRRAEQL